MIKEIFLPEKINHKRVYAQRIVGIAVQDDIVTVAIVYAGRSRSVIEQFLVQTIESGDEESYSQRATQAIKIVMQKVKRFDQVYVAIPTAVVTFKELQMPFLDSEKIRMVLEYEIEAMLPFAISDAVVDFIITKSMPEQGASQVLVAAVRNQDIQSLLDMYEQAGVRPNKVTLDLFSMYGLFQQIPEYKSITAGCALIDAGLHATKIAFLQNGELRLTRSIPRGFSTIAANVSEETKVPVTDVIPKIFERGLKQPGDDALGKSIQKHFINFLNDIQFTLNSFSLKLNFYEGVGRLLFLGKLNNIKDFIEFSSNTLQIPCEIFDSKKLLAHKGMRTKISDLRIVWSDFVIALGAALPSVDLDDFNLRRKSFLLPRYSLIAKQVIVAMALIIITLAVLCVNGYMQVGALQEAVKITETKGIARLKPIIPEGKKIKVTSLQNLVRDAEKVVKDKASLWASFSLERLNVLEILLELTTLIDRSQNDITITEVTINGKDLENTRIELNGFFKSRRGSGSHFNDWAPIEMKFKESDYFALVEEPNPQFAEDKGIKFSLKMKLKKSREKKEK
jgi:Tfp pilus assembly PilM family ATPase